jgi:hypothetical protein
MAEVSQMIPYNISTKIIYFHRRYFIQIYSDEFWIVGKLVLPITFNCLCPFIFIPLYQESAKSHKITLPDLLKLVSQVHVLRTSFRKELILWPGSKDIMFSAWPATWCSNVIMLDWKAVSWVVCELVRESCYLISSRGKQLISVFIFILLNGRAKWCSYFNKNTSAFGHNLL